MIFVDLTFFWPMGFSMLLLLLLRLCLTSQRQLRSYRDGSQLKVLSNRLVKEGSNQRPLVYKASDLSTTPQRLLLFHLIWFIYVRTVQYIYIYICILRGHRLWYKRCTSFSENRFRLSKQCRALCIEALCGILSGCSLFTKAPVIGVRGVWSQNG